MKRFLATLMVVAMMISTMVVGTVPAAAAEVDDAASKYVTLDGDWGFKLYRTYPNMYQYFPYYGVNVKWEDADLAVYPADDAWKEWDVLQMPADDASTGGLLTNDLSPTWSEAWVVREFDLPADFTEEETVTLLMGIIDDNNVVYINGQVVAASGFVDGNGQPTLKIPENGGFDYKAADKADQVKWEKSYWEIQREYTIPADVLNLGGTNEIAVRLYNNNSNGGFYSGQLYAICGNDSAVRELKGLPSQKVDAPAVMNAVEAQNAALAAGDIEAYAETISDNYHNDADVKADKVAEIEAMMADYSAITVADEKAAVYMDDEGGYWYTANRTVTGVNNETQEEKVISAGAVETCFEADGMERGNWNRCYGTSYDSELFGQELTYSVYLPEGYYDSDKEYPVVWLLHGQNSSSTSYRDVDGIGAFMDELITNGEVVEMVVIMPDSGKNAFYRDSAIPADGNINEGGPWATQLTQELRAEVQDNYRVLTDAEFNGLTGNSMGGFGSLNNGALNPDLYSSIGLHMGYLPGSALDSLKTLSAEQLEEYDFYLDCGLQDQTVGYQGTVNVHEYLESMGKDHGYSLRDGAHNSAFYMSGMANSMKMHSAHFVKNGLFEDDADNFLTLEGEWNYKLYRTYTNMFQYIPYAAYGLFGISWEDLETAAYPADGAWKTWDKVNMPDSNPELGGLLGNDLSPTWSEAWVVREFDLPADFANSEEVTLLMGIIDDNDVIYINGTPVASSGFSDGNGNNIINDLELGGFDYAAADKADQVKWVTSYWERQREYTIPADVLNLGGTNEIAVRLYNNNSNGGFYAGNLYALCGNELATRNAKGLPIEKVESAEVDAVVAAQVAAIEAHDIEAFAATVADDYHNDADDKADRVAAVAAKLEETAGYEINVVDENAAIYLDEDGNYWYSAERTFNIGENYSEFLAIELCYQVEDGKALEIGNWNRCYGTSYASELFGENLTYSVYLPPSYYTDTEKEYPVVWLLHGRASSSTSYRDVDDIGAFMDDQIAKGNIVEMVLIMPDSGKYAFYRDSALTPGDKDNSGPWATQLTEELRGVAQEAYRIKTEAKFNGLTGNSMGGYGAMTIGTKNPDLYSSIAVHMGYLPPDALNSLKNLDMYYVLDFDFYLDAGLQDQTVGYEDTVAVHNYLNSVNKAHGYDLRNGTHGSAFYMAGMPASMKMHSDHFVRYGVEIAPGTGSGSTGEIGGGSTGGSVGGGSGSSGGSAEPVKPEKPVEPEQIIVAEAEDFADLASDVWYYEAADFVLNKGIMSGVSEKEFAPQAKLTRGMVVQMLWAMDGKNAPKKDASFSDVADDAWYAEAVAWAAENGISTGYADNTFGANNNITREQMALMLCNYARIKGADMSVGENTNILSYEDAFSISEWAMSALQWACGEGVMSGKTGGYLDPTGVTTRAEAAQMLMKFCGVLAD